MVWFAATNLILPFLVASFGNVYASVHILRNQCWHEVPPLSSVALQSSQDRKFEFAASYQPNHQRLKAHSPWTHKPVCTGHIDRLKSELCVYTDASFSNGRGISIFTTPQVANDFVNLPAFRDAKAMAEGNINTFSGAWYTQSLPGKGIGMLAKKSLKFGDRVTAYTPALLAYLEAELGTMEREKYFRIAVSQLPKGTRDAFLQLATVYGDPRIRHQDVVKANTFQLEISGRSHLAVFPETSRLNHACAPNAQYYLDPERLTHFVHATRSIARGEEITISYTSPLEPTNTRQQHLQSGFHFTCSCARCTDKVARDATLNQIKEMQKKLNDWSGTSSATPKLAEKLLQLYRKEGLEGFLDIPYGFAALAYNAAGKHKEAEKYATKAKEAILMKDGLWSPNLGIWNELLQDPKKHWSYNRRI